MTNKTVTAETLVTGNRIATVPLSDRSFRSRYVDYSLKIVSVNVTEDKVYVYTDYGRYAIPMIYRVGQPVTIVE